MTSVIYITRAKEGNKVNYGGQKTYLDETSLIDGLLGLMIPMHHSDQTALG